MRYISIRLNRWQKRRLTRLMRKTKDAGLRVRINIVLLYAEGMRTGKIADIVRYDRSGVIKVANRFLEEGEDGIRDHRVENGFPKVDDDLLGALALLVGGSPQDYGWARTTWTRELFVRQIYRMTRTQISVSTVARMLRILNARWGRARPIVECPWSIQAKARRLRKIKHFLDNLSPYEVAFYEDEVDIHLNPRIGPDWMLKGQQKKVITPGTNKKHYLAGALNAKTGKIIWVHSKKKDTCLFLALLRRLIKQYCRKKRIHIILDNSRIHLSKAVLRALEQEFCEKIVFHFLPPYSPEHNRIELLWLKLHANVTRNHRAKTMGELMRKVAYFLRRASPFIHSGVKERYLIKYQQNQNKKAA